MKFILCQPYPLFATRNDSDEKDVEQAVIKEKQ